MLVILIRVLSAKPFSTHAATIYNPYHAWHTFLLLVAVHMVCFSVGANTLVGRRQCRQLPQITEGQRYAAAGTIFVAFFVVFHEDID